MCTPRPKLPDTFSVDDLVKKKKRERDIRSCGVRDVPEQKCARKKKWRTRQRERERATNRHESVTCAAATSKCFALSTFRGRRNMALAAAGISRFDVMHRDGTAERSREGF